METLINIKTKNCLPTTLKTPKLAIYGCEEFKHPQKNLVKDKLFRVVFETDAPKSGCIFDLGFDLSFAIRLIGQGLSSKLRWTSFESPNGSTSMAKSMQRHEEQKKKIKNNKLSNRVFARFQNINEFIANYTGEAAHWFLDYCGTLSKNRKAIIRVLSKRLVQKNGVVWITISPRGETQDATKLFNIIKRYGGDAFSFVKLPIPLANEVNEGIYTYNHMFVVVLKRIK